MQDESQSINCPNCNEEMEIVFLEGKGFCVDICTKGCGGIFLDNREFKKIDEKKEDASKIFEKLKDKVFNKSPKENLTRICPVCGHEMIKNYSSHLKKIQIDECYNCGGKFLDNGELKAVRDEFETEEDRIKAFMEFALNEFPVLKEKSKKNKKNKKKN